MHVKITLLIYVPPLPGIVFANCSDNWVVVNQWFPTIVSSWWYDFLSMVFGQTVDGIDHNCIYLCVIFLQWWSCAWEQTKSERSCWLRTDGGWPAAIICSLMLNSSTPLLMVKWHYFRSFEFIWMHDKSFYWSKVTPINIWIENIENIPCSVLDKNPRQRLMEERR